MAPVVRDQIDCSVSIDCSYWNGKCVDHVCECYDWFEGQFCELHSLATVPKTASYLVWNTFAVVRVVMVVWIVLILRSRVSTLKKARVDVVSCAFAIASGLGRFLSAADNRHRFVLIHLIIMYEVRIIYLTVDPHGMRDIFPAYVERTMHSMPVCFLFSACCCIMLFWVDLTSEFRMTSNPAGLTRKLWVLFILLNMVIYSLEAALTLLMLPSVEVSVLTIMTVWSVYLLFATSGLCVCALYFGQRLKKRLVAGSNDFGQASGNMVGVVVKITVLMQYTALSGLAVVVYLILDYVLSLVSWNAYKWFFAEIVGQILEVVMTGFVIVTFTTASTRKKALLLAS